MLQILRVSPSKRQLDDVTICHGYNYGEVPLPAVKAVSGATFKKFATPVDPTHRPAVQISLGCHVVGVAQPHPNPADPDTVEAGVRKRFLLTPPQPNKIRLRKLKRFVLRWCKKNLTPLSPDADVSVDAWLEKTNYPLARRDELRKLWVDNNETLIPRDYKVKSFIKDETYPEYKHARAINSRTDMFKCAVGPIFRLIEEQVFKHPAFIKKVPVDDRPAYLKRMLYREGAKYFWADFTAYESHFTPLIMKSVEFVLYRYMTQYLPSGPQFMSLCENVIAGLNHCVFKFFSVDCVGRRMSGEMNTSLGNGFTNLMLLLFLFEECGESVNPVVEGDDSNTSFMNRHPTAEDFASLGFTVDPKKCGVADSFEEMSFCGMVFDSVDLINVTDPAEVLASFGWARAVYARANKATRMKLLRCKSLSYAHQYPGCPIIQSLAKYGMYVTRSYDVRNFITQSRTIPFWERERLLSALQWWEQQKAEHKVRIPNKQIPLRTRQLVERLYGISVSTQVRIEEYLNGLQELQELAGPIVSLIEFSESSLHYFETYSRKISRMDRDMDYPDHHWARMRAWKREW